MSAEREKLWITYNGEVYNYLELRQELRGLGFRFTTGTDTEVILAAYVAWGTSCFSRFNGMWALAIWDDQKKQLILSRDRFGVKPLHYLRRPSRLFFSSEIKGLLASKSIQVRLDREMAIDYLKWATVNHRTRTFFAEVQAFPPGHFAVVDWDRPTDWKTEPFWSLTTPDEAIVMSMEDASERFGELFRDAVAKRMRSDVPVGSCLSGGLDSSAIVCQAVALKERSNLPFHTFTSYSPLPRFDERWWSELVNQKVGAQSHQVAAHADEFGHDLPQLLWHQEEPFTSGSIYAQWLVMREASRTRVPVLLDGQGADELLCGYRKFYLFYLQELLATKRWLQLGIEFGHLLLSGDKTVLRWREGVRYLPSGLRSRVHALDALLHGSARSMWTDSVLNLGRSRTVNERQVVDLLEFSLPALLRYEDRNSMAWSVETRVPFLDYRLVEFMISLPTSLKLLKGRTKAVMRTALEGLVPSEVLNRRDKMGFETPQEMWMKQDLTSVILERFRAKHLRVGILLRQQNLVEAFEAYLAGRPTISHHELFRIFIMDAWMERFGVAN